MNFGKNFLIWILILIVLVTVFEVFQGSIDNGKCKCSIMAVEANDPLNKVKDGENALAFYSQYYQPIPLVLRGYGAGTEVTAAGVFADVLRTLNWKQEF